MHVLIVEDNTVNQKLVQKTLRIYGCTFSVAWNGREALDYLASDPSTCPRPDIILMDVSMPVMGGHEATSIIRTQPPFIHDPAVSTTPIIALSANFFSSAARNGSIGFDDTINKPIRPERLRRLLLFWSKKRVVPRPDGALPVQRSGNTVPVPPAAVPWGPALLRGYRGPRSLL
ncbi:CheY-like superfamily [Aspergillus aurantiobrunneus]